MNTAQQLSELAVVAAELQSARRLLDEYARYEGSLTGHIAVVIATVREEERAKAHAAIGYGRGHLLDGAA